MADLDCVWIPEAIRTIEGNSDHSAIQIKLVSKGVEVRCASCNKSWGLLINDINVLLIGYSGDSPAAKSPFQVALVTFLAQIMESECWGLPRLQLLAEYLTQRLVTAGEMGISWDQLIREIVVSNKAPGGNVERTVRSLGFEETGAGIRLPEGHPLREW